MSCSRQQSWNFAVNRRKVPNVNLIRRVVIVLFAFTAIVFQAQEHTSSPSLCELQKTATEGSRQTVRVSGVFSEGIDRGVLTDPECSAGNQTWVELQPQSQVEKDQLRRVLAKSPKAKLVFIGEFFGPPKPDQKLPPAIRENYHPGWGHLGAFRTKIVVTEIESVSLMTSPKVDEATAVRIAEKALAKIYGKDKIDSEKPFKAILSDGVWHVGGTLHCKDMNGNDTTVCVGGVAMADVRESDGKVLRTGHTM
jgi:hypothetical protein